MGIRVFQILMTSPQYISQLAIRNSSSLVVKAYGVEHVKEELLYLMPPFGAGVLEVRCLGKACKIFFRSGACTYLALACYLVNLLPDRLLSMVVHVVKELVELLSEEFSQSKMGYTFVQYGLHDVGNALVVGQYKHNLA